jgi:hypothetical protein
MEFFLKKAQKNLIFRNAPNQRLIFPIELLAPTIIGRKGMKKPQNDTNYLETQSNIEQHGKFEEFISSGLKSGGAHIVASKSHGKSRLLFLVFETLQKRQDVRCIAFDGSETWLYSASKVPTFTIQEKDIVAQEVRTTDEMERYALKNWNLVKLALETHKDVLFRLKTRKPSKRGFFVRTIVNHLDALQRQEKADSINHENSLTIAYFIEEAQDCFNNRSSARLDMEEFLTVFNEGRNNKEAFYTASQRLTDFSKTIRSKQLPCIGKLSSEDITPTLRRVEKNQKLEFAKMPPKTWFFEGSTFESPEFKQKGKPYQINKEVKEKWLQSLPIPKKQSFFMKHIFPVLFQQSIKKQKMSIEESKQEEEEDEEMDDMFLLDPIGEN